MREKQHNPPTPPPIQMGYSSPSTTQAHVFSHTSRGRPESCGEGGRGGRKKGGLENAGDKLYNVHFYLVNALVL